jgi:hypothetical protein
MPDRQMDETDGRKTWTQVFKGPYATLLSQKPVKGSQMMTLPGFSVVERVSVRRLPGTAGLMTVTSEDISFSSGDTTKDAEPTFEIEWFEREMPLLSNPGYNNPGPIYMGFGHKEAVQAWMANPSASKKAAGEYWDDAQNAWLKLSDLADYAVGGGVDHAVALIKGGQEAYLEYWPIVRRTREYRSMGATAACGYRISAANLAAGLEIEVPVSTNIGLITIPVVYMKTDDKYTKTGRRGKFERNEEWTGARTWVPEFYPETTSVDSIVLPPQTPPT